MNETNQLAQIALLDASRRAFRSWRCRIVENQDVAGLWLTGLAGEEFDDSQNIRFKPLQEDRLFLLITAYDRYIAHDMQVRAQAMAGGWSPLLNPASRFQSGT